MDIQLVSSFSTTDSVLKQDIIFDMNVSAIDKNTHPQQTLEDLARSLSLPRLRRTSYRSSTSPSEHQSGVLGHVLHHQVIEQSLQDVSEVLQLPMQGHGEQGGHVGPVPRGEGPLHLQGVDELGESGTKGSKQ